MRERTEIHAQIVDFGNRVELRIGQQLAGNRFAVGSVTFTELEDGDYADPSVRLGIPEAQLLMDGLWRCGLRPSEGKGSAGALAATEAHLSDMRTLVFHALNVEQKASR